MTEREREQAGVADRDPLVVREPLDSPLPSSDNELSAVEEDADTTSDSSPPDEDSATPTGKPSPLAGDLEHHEERLADVPPGSEPTDEKSAGDESSRSAAGFDVANLVSALEDLNERIAESQRLLARQNEFADKLHADNQRLRSGELRVAILPLVRDLLRLHDDVGRIANASEHSQDLELVKTSLLDALSRNGVVPARAELGELFDPGRHSAVGVVDTDSAESDRCIAEVSRIGFEWEDGHAIRVAEVGVYRCILPSPPSSRKDQHNESDQSEGPG